MDLGTALSSVQSIIIQEMKLKNSRLTRGQSSNASETSRLEKAKQLLAHFQVRHFSDVVLTNEKIFTIEPPPNRQNQAIASSGKKSLKRRLASNRLFLKVSWLRLVRRPLVKLR